MKSAAASAAPLYERGGLFRLEVKPVSRANGSSAVAKSAYGAGERLVDLRTGRVHDFRRKCGVFRDDLSIVGPALMPKEMLNRRVLWNAAEICEKRQDARVARLWLLSLPHELSHAERLAIVQEFAAWLVDKFGVVVDVAIHAPDKDGDPGTTMPICSARRARPDLAASGRNPSLSYPTPTDGSVGCPSGQRR